MKYCSKCGREIGENEATFCSHCGQKLELGTDSQNQSSYQTLNPSQSQVKDNPSHFAGAVSCCFPIVGLILYFLWRDEKPQSAQLLCYWMIAGVAAYVLFYLIFGFIGFMSY